MKKIKYRDQMNFLKEPSRRSTALDSLKAQQLLDGGRERESKILRQVDRRHAAPAHGGQERRGGGVQLRLRKALSRARALPN